MTGYSKGVTSAVVALMLVSPLPVLGQATTAPAAAGTRHPRVPVTVVLQDTAAASTSFRILRRADQQPLDVIVLSGPADGETLSEAVRNLLMVRQIAGDTAIAAAQVRVRRTDAPASRRPYPWADRVVNDLRVASPRAVVGVGTVQAVEIWFPPQHRVVTQQSSTQH